MNKDTFYKKYKKVGQVSQYEVIEDIEDCDESWIVIDGDLYSRKWEME